MSRSQDSAYEAKSRILDKNPFYQAGNQPLLGPEVTGINTRTKIAIAALLAVCILVTGVISVVYYTSVIHEKDNQITTLKARVAELQAQVDRLNEQITQLKVEIDEKNGQIEELKDQLNSLNSQAASLNSQIADLNAQIAQLMNAPNLVVDNIRVNDDRSSEPYNLHIICRVNNTGGRTAYQGYLHVMAQNIEGNLAIDYMYPFTGITAHMDLTLDFKVNYTGSPIHGWSIDPVWTDRSQTGQSGQSFEGNYTLP